MSLFFCLSYRKRIGIDGSLLWFWFIFSGLLISFNPLANHPLQFRLDASGAQAVFISAFVPFFILRHKFNLSLFLVGSLLIFFINSFFVIFKNYGIFHAGSIDTAVMAVIAGPMLALAMTGGLNKLLKFILLFVIFAIFYRKGATGVLTLILSCIAYFVADKKPKKSLWAVLILLAIGAYTQKGELLDDSGRFGPWINFVEYWQHNLNIWIGSGSGSFEWLGYEADKNPKSVFLWAHNEYIQVLFEQGLIGFTLLCILMTRLVVRSYRDPLHFSLLVGICFSSLFQSPFRFVYSQVLFLVIILEILETDKKTSFKK